LQTGRVEILGFDLARQPDEIRRRIGIVFQAPSLDKKLTVAENMRHQGHLYGLSGALLQQRQTELLAQLGLADRLHERTETLSGGLRRRVELAKGMLHHPQLLLLDEPSTGLDPGARADLWDYLGRLQQQGVTIVLTTHLLVEAFPGQIEAITLGKPTLEDVFIDRTGHRFWQAQEQPAPRGSARHG